MKTTTIGQINSKEPIRIYDDRGKNDELYVVSKVLYEDEANMLVQVDNLTLENNKFFLRKSDGKILSSELDSWYAENFETLEMKKTAEAIKFFKTNSILINGTQSLLIGDSAKLINLLLKTNLTVSDLK